MQKRKPARRRFISRVDGYMREMAPSDGSAPLSPHLALADFMQRYWPEFRDALERDDQQ